MKIETPRTVIRGFTMEDARPLHEIFSDGETMAYVEPPYDLERTTEFLQSFCIGRQGAFACVERSSGKLIGYLLFKAMEEGVYEMGWIFHRAYWRRGYAYESCRALMDHAFQTLNAHKVFAETIDADRSVGLMKKLGMCPEGIQRSQARDDQGRWADLHLYGILRTDYTGSGGDILEHFSL